MDDNVASYYPNALCFEDLSQISFLGNWFDGEYRSVYISIDACKNTLERPNKCEPPEEIERWMNTNLLYIVAQKTIVNKEIWEEDSNPMFNDQHGYYPMDKEP